MLRDLALTAIVPALAVGEAERGQVYDARADATVPVVEDVPVPQPRPDVW
jgi:hypothetical protein